MINEKIIIKINDKNSIQIIKQLNIFVISHLKNNIVCNDVINNKYFTTICNKHNYMENVDDVVINVLYDILNEIYYDVKLIENTIRIETSIYIIFVDVFFNNKTNKLNYYLSTIQIEKFNPYVNYSENEKTN